MAFYNDKIIIAEEVNKALYIIRKSKKEIFMHLLLSDKESFKKKTLARDSIEDFDACFNHDELNLVYKNDKKELMIQSLKDDKTEVIMDNLDNMIYELNLIIKEDEKNIFYMEASKEDKKIYYINHIIFDKGKNEKNIVDKIETYNFINPLKVILDEDNIYVAYYFKNQICLKEYNLTSKIWSPSFTLTDNKNKLYLDMAIIGNNLHLVYSVYKDDNFNIKYEKFYIKKDDIIKEREQNLSGVGNHTDPILIYHLSKLWVVWKSTNQFLSTLSEDNGDTFIESYTWRQSPSADLVKYKYISDIIERGNKIDYSYGSYYPEIKFIGFGKSD